MSTIVQGIETPKLSVTRGALLVSGTCIGGGMLAMPIQTADAGFVMALITLVISWIFMTFTGLLLIEATLWLKNRAHFSSIAQALLGTPGKILSLCVYLFMNTTSLVAYTSGGALLVDYWIKSAFGISLGYEACCVLFTALFGGIVSFGALFIGKINGWFVVVMGAIYCYLVGWGMFGIQPDYLVFRPAWFEGLSCFPLIFAAFSHQMIVPSLCSYLGYEVRNLKKAIWIGTTLSFFVYFSWLLVVHGLVPFEGANGLHEAFVNNALIVEPLKNSFPSSWFLGLIDSFAFIALATSYLGLSTALFDFVDDLFRGIGKYPSKYVVVLCSILPCLILAMLFPKALLDFLDISGGFGDALLSGMIPVAMIWVGRYRKNYESEYQVFGGKTTLILAGLFALLIFFVQWVKLFW